MPSSPGAPSPEELEARIAELRTAVRRAMATGDRQAARAHRAELRAAERAWDEAVLGDTALGDAELGGPAPDETAPDETAGGAPSGARPAPAPPPRAAVPRGLVPVRERVHQALTLIGAPAAPKLIASVYAAFLPGQLPAARLTSLRRDEERSFRSAPYARPYYLCAALTADLLAPARGLLTVSTWPLEQRISGPLSARTDFLTAAIRIAEHAGRRPDSPDVQRLLWRFAANIPGAATGAVGTVEPGALIAAARAELDVHAETDRRQRRRAADRARAQLDDAGRLFGARLRAMRSATGTTDGEDDR
ncbi:hypothetical protein ACSNOI_00535 [Actinomadura kijaniata]|uniref:hypothetical protein n=1 Tax=Actinomadura kijaniata TaxID=46161 RepID=UPI003F1A2C76